MPIAQPSSPAWVLLLALCGSPGALQGQAQEDTLRIRRLSAPIVFDGMPDEPAWEEIAPLPLTAFTPVFGGPLTERTEIRLAYDETYLYISGRMYQTDPKTTRIQTFYRDGAMGDDLLGLLLDTYNDHQTASWFAINPAAVRTDRSLSNDAESGQIDPMNTNWNAFWDAATARTPHGWFAEVRVPLSSLGFQDVGGRVVMGVAVYRVVASRNERQIFPPTSPQYGDLAFAKPSRFRPMVLEGVRSHRPAYFRPYALGGRSREAALNPAGTAYTVPSSGTYEAGLDLRLSPASNLTLDLSANTDFAQVEADDQQVNLTRFSLFFPEKRQFFQERASLFDFGTGDETRLFHSRRIGLVEETPIRLLGGARLVGRLGRTDLGVIDMQSAARDGLRSENLGVLRLRRQILNANSTVGAMITSRYVGDTSYNVAAGADATLRPVGDQYLILKWAQTFDADAPGVRGLDLAASRWFARWERRNQAGFRYAEELIRSGPLYQPRLGYTIRNDFSSSETRLQYLWFGGPRVPLRTFAIQAASKAFLRNSDRTVESALIQGGFDSQLKEGQQVTFTYRASYESVRDTFSLSGGVPILVGDYWFREVNLEFQAARQSRFRPSMSLTVGSFYDGHRVSLAANPAWDLSSHLQLGVDYLLNALRFPDRGISSNLHVARARIQAGYDARLSLSTFLQYSNATRTVSVNARLRYNFREGNDLWVVYDEAANTARDGLVPEPPVSQHRALLVKYTHTLVR
jgi:hypothetical protein